MASVKEIKVPNIGEFNDVDVIEILAKPGDRINPEDSLITLESDKATMEVPSPEGGIVKDVLISVGDKVSEGIPILTLETVKDAETATAEPPTSASEPAATEPPEEEPPPEPPHQPSAAVHQLVHDDQPIAPQIQTEQRALPHASPSVRRFARELGVDLSQVKGSGPKGRITRENVQSFVKGALGSGAAAVGSAQPSLGIPRLELPDFSQFGEVEHRELSRIQKLSGAHLHKCWLNIPHVTQFDEADITALEEFRQSMKKEADSRGVRLTLLAFLIKACVAALKEYPQFNSSLTTEGDALLLKRYYHIGVAVDTRAGLMVPVIKEADKKGLFELAETLAALSQKARDGKLSPTDMQGGCFSISSLGGIGGTAFTPIVNGPEVAILGVSRAVMKPLWQAGEFVPRLMLPLSLSYDHRVIDGAQAARFTRFLSQALQDLRRLLL
ncbi:dihydrolipoyllysine-residue acetyltransferase [Nitrococcus mobilis]|uniref:Acetyltransferase component of pyruvate dehydrogenase complex n=1 Tax=Nitrococcus mobilis Nb-231 TaxID=314278 RepID=A4BP49_9GAMM|nr:dihydrolipoyllysine-residue acetyltransferase [Nitrococcus mobilis]EAR22350.1 Catalytic domain of component of various dehydrogenase complexes [Nitrococcus mobilis Nb-231]